MQENQLVTLRTSPLLLNLTVMLGMLVAVPAMADSEQPTTILILGEANELPALAGAGQAIDEQALEASRVFTINEALRRVPGVHVRDEEGFGLRPNIGIRGLNPTRSTKITLLEDGLPLAYSPYGDNATYYHPPIDRYARIEVLKGAASLLYGPQTVGGIVNYVIPSPPEAREGWVQGTVGSRDYANAHARFGGAGWLFDAVHKSGAGARDRMHSRIDDVNLTYTTTLAHYHTLRLRANAYREDSELTYSGLTQAEYQQLGPRYNPFRNDRFDATRQGYSSTYEYSFGDGSTFTASAYYSRFDRDWWRQASNSQDAQCGAAFNAARLAGIAVDVDSCNSTQGRLRKYWLAGIEPRLFLHHRHGELEAGIKFHVEDQDRMQVNAPSATGRSGGTVERNLRHTKAYSAYLGHRFEWANFDLLPIVRFESVEAERINRLTAAAGETRVSQLLSGLGATWNPTDSLTVFGSVHQGFAPPRVEDLIGVTGALVDVDAERSTNLEFGVRHTLSEHLNYQLAAFQTDYGNLIAVGSIAGGGTPLSQGRARFRGVEFGLDANHDGGGYGRVAATWLPSAEQVTAFRNVVNGQAANGSVAGRRQPYAPRVTATVALGIERGRAHVEIEAQHVGAQYTDFANTLMPTADGQRGLMSSYTLINGVLNWQMLPELDTYVTVKNLSDHTHIVERTRGIQVGMPRSVQAGMRYRF